jgi:hypothetical protein
MYSTCLAPSVIKFAKQIQSWSFDEYNFSSRKVVLAMRRVIAKSKESFSKVFAVHAPW